MRRVVAGVLLLAALILTAAPANAQSNPPQFGGTFDVIEVNGLIDPVTAGFIERSLAESEANGAAGVILQMESVGAAISDEEVAALATRIAEFEVPVSVWLGPSGNGRALGRAGQIALAASRIGISPGSEIGDFGESVLEGAALDSPFVSILEGGFAGEVVGYDELLAIGLEDRSLPIQDAPVILNHLLELPGFEDDILQAGDTLPNGSVLADDADATRIPVSPTRFVTLPLIDQQFHTFASPPVAYLLFIIGLGLLVFELFTAGVGIAGVLGAGSVLAGSYGLAILDARSWAVALLVIAFIGFAIDVQSGIQAFWSGVGVVFSIIGSIFLIPGHDIGWLPFVVGIVGVNMAMLSGMPAMVRTRFSTPTIGREWMIGEVGDVVEAVDPDGVVTLRGAPWRARTNRATPLAVGERARVIEVDGLLLEVEPEVGGAIDYREKRRNSDDSGLGDAEEFAADVADEAIGPVASSTSE